MPLVDRLEPSDAPTFDGFGDAATPRQGLTPTFDGFGQEPPGIAGAAPGGRAQATGLPGVMEAAPSRRPGPAASGWPKPSKVGAKQAFGLPSGQSRRKLEQGYGITCLQRPD